MSELSEQDIKEIAERYQRTDIVWASHDEFKIEALEESVADIPRLLSLVGELRAQVAQYTARVNEPQNEAGETAVEPEDIIIALRAELATSQSMTKRWKAAIEGLTPNGSEYVDDPEACAAAIRERTRWPQQIIKLRDELTEARAEQMASAKIIAELTAELAALKAKDETPLCPVHKRIDELGTLEMEIGGLNCVACSLQERVELLALIAPFADGSKDSVTVLREVADFWEAHHGDNRVVVSYPASAENTEKVD